MILRGAICMQQRGEQSELGETTVCQKHKVISTCCQIMLCRRTFRGGEEYKEKKTCILFLNCTPPNFQDLIITAGATNNSHTRGFNGCSMLIRYESGCFADGPPPTEFFVIQNTQRYNLFGGLFRQMCCPQTSGKVMALI